MANNPNRRSAIPVLIQQSLNTAAAAAAAGGAGATSNQGGAAVTTAATTTNARHLDMTTSASNTSQADTSHFRIPQFARAPRTAATLSQRFEQQQHQQENVQIPLFGEVSSEDEQSAAAETNDDEAEDDDEEDDYEEDDDDVDDEDDEDEWNTSLFEVEDLNSTFNLDLLNEIQNARLLSNTTQRPLNVPEVAPAESAAAASGAESEQNPPPTSEASAEGIADEINPAEIAAAAVANTDEPLQATEMATEEPSDEATSSTGLDSVTEPLSITTTTAATAETNAEALVISDTETTASSIPVPAAPANVVEMSPEVRAALGDLEVPEGVDPSFLAALPSEMREEVIQEHLRMQRIRQRAQQNAIQVAHDSLVEVNPEFLAALPPNIQSEVLMQQRIEQQRQAAQTANPEDPVDTAAFFQNLPESLRQAILTDMEESQIASLPPDLAAEAQYLRRDWETRNGARLDAAQSNTLSGYLTARFPSSLQNLNDESRWHTNSIWYDANGLMQTPQSQHHQHTTIVHQHQQQLHGKPIALLLMEDENNLLDPDSLTTLLLFLFIEDSKLNYTRLHRVVRNLCYHLPTREWIIGALISIIQKTNEGKVNYSARKGVKPQWLKLRVDAAFGYKSNVFIINKFKDTNTSGSGSASSTDQHCISINPQAAQMIVRNCLDMLFVLAKHFPRSFVPFNRELKNRGKHMDMNVPNSSSNETIGNIPMAVTITAGSAPGTDNEVSPEELRALFQRHHPSIVNFTTRRSAGTATAPQAPALKASDLKFDDCPSTSKAAAVRNQQKPNVIASKNKLLTGGQYNTNGKHFWDVLLNIDVNTQQRLANVQAFPVSSQPTWEWEVKMPEFLAFNDSPFAKLLEMLPYKVICRSPQLTDMLGKLLASLSGELPKEDESPEQPAADESQPQTAATSNQVAGAATATTPPPPPPPSTEAPPPTAAKSKDSLDGNSSSDDEDKSNQQPALVKSRRKMYSKNFSQLQLVIEVLTHQCGTTDGLDNISKLIVNLSQCSQASNAIFLQYLTAAILGLAQEVRQAIQSLLDEIRAYNVTNNDKAASTSAKSFASTPTNPAVHQGIMQDRFTAENVVISASTNIKPSCELQLPAMKKLLSSSSAQPYFLRTLKIFMQVRELFESQENSADPNAAATTTNNQKPTLSQIICLDDLWNTLSECLVALEESKDEYAVLVLQPTVEAFFLIHASHKKNSNKPESTNAAAGQAGQNSGAGDESNSNSTATAAGAASTATNTTTPIDLGTNSLQTSPQPSSETLPDVGVTTSTQPLLAQNMTDSSSPSSSSSSSSSSANTRENQLKLDRHKFLLFAEKHRTVLNQILRQSPTHLSDGPFAVLVDHTRILDFDVKRKYFQTELERIDEGVRREENTVSVRRVTVFEDSFRVLYRLGPEEWKNRFYIVFEDEEGQDAGGLLREWYVIISREIFNPMYALFCVSPGDRVTYMINPSSHANPNHLSYFKFVGRVIAKAVHDNKLLECYFTRSFYKHILGKLVKYTDMESQDYEFYKGLDYLMKNDISTLGYELTFSTEVQEFGVTQVRDLIPNGRDIAVTEENKFDYVQLVCQLKMSGSIRQQLDAFLEGFYDIIPKHLISIFNEQELELLISGLPDIDIEDLKANTEYHKYTSKSIQIQWFWRALRSFDQADRAKFLQFVTGTSKVPLQGFSSLEGMNGIQKFQIHRDDRSTDRLPCAHTCFNQLDLPMYKSYDKLRSCLLKAIHECSEGFGFA